jgi:hypothetical protein
MAVEQVTINGEIIRIDVDQLDRQITQLAEAINLVEGPETQESLDGLLDLCIAIYNALS